MRVLSADRARKDIPPPPHLCGGDGSHERRAHVLLSDLLGEPLGEAAPTLPTLQATPETLTRQPSTVLPSSTGADVARRRQPG